MVTNERTELNGILGDKGTLLEYCPTSLLRQCLSDLGIDTIGLTRAGCVLKLGVLGYERLYDDSYTPNENDRNFQYTKDIVVAFDDQLQSTTDVIKERSIQSYSVPNIIVKDVYANDAIYDAKFKNMECNNVFIGNGCYVNSTDLIGTLDHIQTQVATNFTNVQSLNTPIQEAYTKLGTSITYGENNEFSNISNPFISVYPGKGEFYPIKSLETNQITFDFEKSYIFVREVQMFYEITVEIKGMNVTQSTHITSNKIKLLDLASIVESQNGRLVLDDSEDLRVPFVIKSGSGHVHRSMSPGIHVQNNNIYIWTTLFTTHTPGGVELITPNLPVTIQFHYSARKRINDSQGVNPFMTAIQESNTFVTPEINLPADNIHNFDGKHNWVDTLDSTKLSTRIYYNQSDMRYSWLPRYIVLKVKLPHDSAIVDPTTYTGSGLLILPTGYRHVDVCIKRDLPDDEYKLNITLESEIIKYMDTVEMITQVSYNLLTNKRKVFKPIMRLDERKTFDVISISNINILDTMNDVGVLDIAEYYNLRFTYVDTMTRYIDTTTIPSLTYELDTTNNDSVLFANILISDSETSTTLINAYTLRVTVLDDYTKYTYREQPHVPETIHMSVPTNIWNVKNNVVHHLIKTEDVEAIIQTVDNDMVVDSLTVNVYQHLPSGNPGLSNLQFSTGADNTFIVTLASNVDVSTDYVAVHNLSSKLSQFSMLVENFESINFDIIQYD